MSTTLPQLLKRKGLKVPADPNHPKTRLALLAWLVELTGQPATLRYEPDFCTYVLEIDDTTYVAPNIGEYLVASLNEALNNKG